MYAFPALSARMQTLSQTGNFLHVLKRSIGCRRGCSNRSDARPRRAAFSISASSTLVTPQQLVIDTTDDVHLHFGQFGDFVKNGTSYKYKTKHDGWQELYKGRVIKDHPSDYQVQLPEPPLYGPGRYLVQNKGLVLWACKSPLPDGTGEANETEQAIILAIAMQESDCMDKRDIGDPRKTGDSENRSCLNANKDMLKRANGWSWPEPNEISPVDELRLVVGCMLKWLRGQVTPEQDNRRDRRLKDTLNFLRGGFPTFQDHNGTIFNSSLEDNTDDYLNAIASIYWELRWNAKGPTSPWHDGMEADQLKHNPAISNWEPDNLYANNTRIWINIPGI